MIVHLGLFKNHEYGDVFLPFLVVWRQDLCGAANITKKSRTIHPQIKGMDVILTGKYGTKWIRLC
jgi:hypothetical protein